MKKNTPEKILRLALIVWFLIAVTCLSVDVATNLWLCSELQTVEKQQVDTLDQIEMHRTISEPIEDFETEDIDEAIAESDDTELVPLGEFTITHYCPCVKCCGKNDGITKSGTTATEGRTVGVDPNVIPLGSKVWINGNLYVAEDTGYMTGNRIDMFVNGHEEALKRGVFKADVYVEKEK